MPKKTNIHKRFTPTPKSPAYKHGDKRRNRTQGIEKSYGVWGFTQKTIFTILIAVLVLLALNRVIQAEDFGNIGNPVSSDDFGVILGKIANFLIRLAIPALIVIIVVIGFLFIAAQGNEEKLAQAKKWFYYAVIGAAIIFAASILAKIVANFAKSLGP